MKLQLTLLAAMLAAASTIYAADEHPVDAKAETPKAEKAEVKKPVKKHSHMEEKTGMPASEAPRGKSHRESMPKDMPMHDHTQDRH